MMTSEATCESKTVTRTQLILEDRSLISLAKRINQTQNGEKVTVDGNSFNLFMGLGIGVIYNTILDRFILMREVSEGYLFEEWYLKM